MRDTRGITLIALIITIIVVAILAGVSINLVIRKNGLITKTINAKSEYEKEQIKENIKLKIADEEMKKIQLDTNLTYQDMQEILEQYGTINKVDNTIKSITTTKGGYQIAFEEIYSGKLNDNVKTVQIVINLSGVEQYLSSNQIVIETEEGMTWREWFDTPYRVASDQYLENVNIHLNNNGEKHEPFKWYWADDLGEEALVLANRGAYLMDEKSLIKPDSIMTNKLELNFEYSK